MTSLSLKCQFDLQMVENIYEMIYSSIFADMSVGPD